MRCRWNGYTRHIGPELLRDIDEVHFGETHVLLLTIAVDKGEAGVISRRRHKGILILQLQLVGRVLAPAGARGGAHGGVVPALMEMGGLTVSLGLLATPADEEEAAAGCGAHEKNEAENGKGDDQR